LFVTYIRFTALHTLPSDPGYTTDVMRDFGAVMLHAIKGF